MLSARPAPSPTPLPGGPLSRFLLDPDGFLAEAWRAARRLLGPVLAWGVRVLVVAACCALIVFAIRAVRSRRATRDGVRLRIFPPPEIQPDGAAVLWMGLHALIRPWWRRVLFGQPHLGWEVTADGADANVSLWFPHDVPEDLVARVVESSWPGARAVRAASESLDLLARGRTSACELVLMEPDRFPIGEGAGEDPLRLALGALSLVESAEFAVVQILARPATVAGRRRLRRDARQLRREQNHRLVGSGRPSGPADPAIDADVRAVLAKAGSPLWEASVRIAVSSADARARRGKIHALAGAFAVFDGRNAFARKHLRGGRHAIIRRRLGAGYFLSAPELARIATLPSAEALPALERARARTVAPPRDVPLAGVTLGISDHPGHRRPVAISPADAAQHLHVIGETGTGKSTLIARMVLADAAAGRAAVVIDPKGDLVEDILHRLPEEAVERTCLLDPTDRRHAVGLNVLEGSGEDPDLIADNITAIFKRLFENHWGPRSDDIMRAACLTLTQVPGATLAEVDQLLTSDEWLRQIRSGDLLREVPHVNVFWNSYQAMSEAQRDAAIAPLMNKLRTIVMRTRLLAVVGQPEPKLNISNLIDNGGLLLVRIPKGPLGEDTSRLLGAFVVARVWQACMRRAARPEHLRAPTALYVDEMHNYLALPRSFEDILAEARGYRLSLVLAHQHLGQLPRSMREALAANARTKIAFSCSPEDAYGLEKFFAPALGAHDLANLETFQAACRPLVDGGRRSAFTFRTQPLDSPARDRLRRVRASSAEAFAAPRKVVEAEINSRHKAIEDLDRIGSRAAGYRDGRGGR